MGKVVNPSQFGRLDPANWRDVDDHYTQSIWPDKLPSSPSDYGTPDFHGRTHPEIIRVALIRYTKPGDIVWDPMAGGGTTIDVCRELNNECVAGDLTPIRNDIIQADARVWRPYEGVADNAMDMVVLHPPYMDIVEYPGEGTLATGNIGEWSAGMFDVIRNVTKALKLYHVLVIIIGQVYKDSQVYPLDYELWPMLEDYRLLGKVTRGFGETKGGAISGMKNENLWKYRRLKYGIWALGAETVLFLQRIN